MESLKTKMKAVWTFIFNCIWACDEWMSYCQGLILGVRIKLFWKLSENLQEKTDDGVNFSQICWLKVCNFPFQNCTLSWTFSWGFSGKIQKIVSENICWYGKYKRPKQDMHNRCVFRTLSKICDEVFCKNI